MNDHPDILRHRPVQIRLDHKNHRITSPAEPHLLRDGNAISETTRVRRVGNDGVETAGEGEQAGYLVAVAQAHHRHCRKVVRDKPRRQAAL